MTEGIHKWMQASIMKFLTFWVAMGLSSCALKVIPRLSVNAVIDAIINPSPQLDFGSTAYRFAPNFALSLNPLTLSAGSGATITNCALDVGSPALPAGITIDSSTCTVTGTAVVNGAATVYTVVVTNSFGNSVTATVNVEISDQVPSLQYTPNPYYAVMNPSPYEFSFWLPPTTLDPGVGKFLDHCSVSPATPFPAEYSINPADCSISGYGTAPMPDATYLIEIYNTDGDQSFTTVRLGVYDTPTLAIDGTNQILNVGDPVTITPVTLTKDSRLVISNCVDHGGGLPPSLTVDPTTCVISGTPTLAEAQTGTYHNYSTQIRVTDSYGSTSTSTFNFDLRETPALSAFDVLNQGFTSDPTNDPNVNLSYSMSAGSSDEYCVLEGVGAAVGSCVWSAVSPSAFTLVSADGVIVMNMWVRDSYGRTSAQNVSAITLDRSEPAPTAISLQGISSPNNQTSFTVRVATTTPGNTVTVYSDAGCSTSIGSDTGGAGTTDVVVTLGGGDATYPIHATIQDSLGNISACSTAYVDYTLDTSVTSLAGIQAAPTTYCLSNGGYGITGECAGSSSNWDVSQCSYYNSVNSVPSYYSPIGAPTVKFIQSLQSDEVITVFTQSNCSSSQSPIATTSLGVSNPSVSVPINAINEVYVEILDTIGNKSACVPIFSYHIPPLFNTSTSVGKLRISDGTADFDSSTGSGTYQFLTGEQFNNLSLRMRRDQADICGDFQARLYTNDSCAGVASSTINTVYSNSIDTATFNLNLSAGIHDFSVRIFDSNTNTAISACKAMDPIVRYQRITNLQYGGSMNLSLTKNVAMDITPTYTGTAPSSWNIKPALPAGLTFDSATGRIHGTPTTAVVDGRYVIWPTYPFRKAEDKLFSEDWSVLRITVPVDPVDCDIAGTPYGGGAGTIGDPYKVCTRAQLAAISGAHHFKLMANIDLMGLNFMFNPGRDSDYGTVYYTSFQVAPNLNSQRYGYDYFSLGSGGEVEADYQWSAVNSDANMVFDGNGMQLQNARVRGSGWLGIFKYGNFSNLIVDHVEAIRPTAVAGATYIGGLVAEGNVLSDISLKNTVIATVPGGIHTQRLGGLAGTAFSVEDIDVNGVKIYAGGLTGSVGGIAGSIQEGTGQLSGQNIAIFEGGSYTGGLFGMIEFGIYTNSYLTNAAMTASPPAFSLLGSSITKISATGPMAGVSGYLNIAKDPAAPVTSGGIFSSITVGNAGNPVHLFNHSDTTTSQTSFGFSFANLSIPPVETQLIKDTSRINGTLFSDSAGTGGLFGDAVFNNSFSVDPLDIFSTSILGASGLLGDVAINTPLFHPIVGGSTQGSNSNLDVLTGTFSFGTDSNIPTYGSAASFTDQLTYTGTNTAAPCRITNIRHLGYENGNIILKIEGTGLWRNNNPVTIGGGWAGTLIDSAEDLTYMIYSFPFYSDPMDDFLGSTQFPIQFGIADFSCGDQSVRSVHDWLGSY